MSNISVTATCRRNRKGFLYDVVILVIGGHEFVSECPSPESAQRIAEETLKDLGIWQKT